VEKYSVLEKPEGEGGNYPSQDDFGWTSEIYLTVLQG
jgi:neutral trehalase